MTSPDNNYTNKFRDLNRVIYGLLINAGHACVPSREQADLIDKTIEQKTGQKSLAGITPVGNGRSKKEKEFYLHEHQLRLATIVSFAPVSYQQLLKADAVLDAGLTGSAWHDKVVEFTTAHASAEATLFDYYGGKTSCCPLCQAAPQDMARSGHGFKLPTGLKSHLDGSHSGKKCKVMDAAEELAEPLLSCDAFGQTPSVP